MQFLHVGLGCCNRILVALYGIFVALDGIFVALDGIFVTLYQSSVGLQTVCV